MSKRRKSPKSLEGSESVKGILEPGVECPSCKKWGKVYLVGGFGFSGGAVDVSIWKYHCAGCGHDFEVHRGV